MENPSPLRSYPSFQYLACSLFFLLTFFFSYAQDELDLARQAWPAYWITYPEGSAQEFGVYLFRKNLQWDDEQKPFTIHLSADNRYKMYVNGQYIGNGPARGDLANWRYETYDIAPHLETGENILAVKVWNFAEHRPMAQFSLRTGLIVQGGEAWSQAANTGDGQWRVWHDEAYAPIPVDGSQVMGYFVVGPGEQMEAARHPWGWELQGFTMGEGWKVPKQQQQGKPQRGSYKHGGMPDYLLMPRGIPVMEEREEPLGRLRRASLEVEGEMPIRIPANAKDTLLFDHGTLTTAYPVLSVAGGKGAKLKVIYAESLRDNEKDKGNRDEIKGKQIYGYHDLFILDGEDRRFQTLWWRTFRYVQLEVETGEEPLEVRSLKSIFTAYPFEEKASFQAPEPVLKDIWDIGWRTQRLCAGETYFDCPYYEQLQYAGDTRIQALLSFYVSGDDRLFRRAIMDFHNSHMALGLTQSRYPSHYTQVIPPYALFWIAMVYDYWMHVDDPETVENMLPTIMDILDWYKQRMGPDGLLAGMEWWNFVDWVNHAGWESGVPPGAETDGSAVISLQLAYNLQLAAPLFEAFGYTDMAGEYRQRAASLGKSVKEHCWDEERALLADTPAKTYFSQHTNVMAILTDALPENEQPALKERLLADSSLAQCSYYYFFYLTRALEKAGLADRYLSLLGPWEAQLEQGLTTFVEEPYPSRSDCHAWSASPVYEMLALVAGIKPAGPGFKKVNITPHFNGLPELQANMPHPLGEIVVDLKRDREDIAGRVVLPEGVSGKFLWRGKQIELAGGENRIRE